ncbi:MAG: DUF4180 domain-containing protein [Bacteroidales bacterium]|nr:DUF4180 domain-containing protein [Bacteroidales bacterium]
MQINYLHPTPQISIAELADEFFLVTRPQDVLDIFGDLMSRDCERIIIHERNLHADFFDLKTRLAGEILQKFSNYRVKLAIVGDFTKYQSQSLQDFIFESNKSNYVLFTDNIDLAIQKLGK